jgi:eukaryotic-like serine/threonine-protein kinase
MVGQTISHYRVIERLGGGGMGVVYKAIDERLNRFVALKFLAPELTKDPDANERFRHEAQAASALDHPNICTIHEIDETPSRELFLTMAYYDEETLKARIDRGPLPVEEVIDIAVQVAQALSRAHASGIVHRDIKPANVMITKDGLVKILDFGLAKLAGPNSDLTRTGTTLGTVAYMSPEQIRGGDVGAATDIWSLGVVLYEMLTRSRPFQGKDDLAVLGNILDDAAPSLATRREGVPSPLVRVIARALEKRVASRYQTASEMLADLVASRAAVTGVAAVGGAGPRRSSRIVIVAAATIVLISAGLLATVAYRLNARTRWAHDEAIPEIKRLIAADNSVAAFNVAREVDRVVPNESGLTDLWPQFSALASIVSTPDGADVYMQPYAAVDDHWEHLGRTPIANARLPRVVMRFRIEKEGYEPATLAATNPSSLLRNATGRLSKPLTIELMARGTAPDMVVVPGGTFPVALSGFESTDVVTLDAFRIDKHEVTNKAFKRFVDAGGYAKPEYWQGLPARPDERFRDSTDRPGPSTWELGGYPSGQDEHPVGGVSWFEASAYCRSVGKRLPTMFHWTRAALAPDEQQAPIAPSIIPLSNYGLNGPARVGTFRGVGPYGTFDMGGNVREWVWNETTDSRRWILGGAWNDPDWMLIQRNSSSPFDRAPVNGFRCATYVPPAVASRVVAPVDFVLRDARTARAVSNEVYDVFTRQLSYAKSALNDRLESTDTRNQDWIKEKISFDAGYDSGRVPAYLFLPRNATPPYQLVVMFTGLTAFAGRASSENLQPGFLDFVVKSGRALLWPVFKGSYERWDTFLNLQGEASQRQWRARMFEWRQEMGRALDVMAARRDIDIQRVGYVGVSFGSSMPLPILAVEDRFKVAVLLAAGISYRRVPPEADSINYVSHITMPVLMVGGRRDFVFPLEESQKPLFDRLGTPAADKKHVIFEAGHAADFPRSQGIREVLGWLDRYLGPVTTRGGA